MAKIKLIISLTLMLLCMGVFNVTIYASIEKSEETLAVNAAWVDGELLRINVTDINGNTSSIALHLADYMHDAENNEYISIQAVDLIGNMSGIIQIRNPFFDPNATPPMIIEPPTQSSVPDDDEQTNNMRPLTPDGTGSVIDNVHDSDGIEFFTIGTEDGNVFYLIVDRQRNTDNVYFLNTVMEEDLISLAQAGGREVTPSGINGIVSAIPTPEQPVTPNESNEQELSDTNEQESEASTPRPARNNNSILIIFVIALAVGGAGYYFKIVKPKQNAAYDDDDEDNYGYEGESGDDDYSDDEDGDDE